MDIGIRATNEHRGPATGSARAAGAAGESRPGADRPEDSLRTIFDCHDEAFYVWRDMGVRGATLVHVDAHHDVDVTRDPGPPDIANFVRAAVDAGLVERLFWILPDPMWADPTVHAIALRDAGEMRRFVPVWTGPLGALAVQPGPVLLDIDLDYLFTVAFDEQPSRGRLADPHTDADRFAAAIAARCPIRSATTIATSLTGGYAPLGWKHLAGEIAARLEGRPVDPGPRSAAADFRLAERLLEDGRLEDARAAFGRAVAADPAYRHPFRTNGHVYLAAGDAARAETAFRRGRALDPGDPWAALGLAMIALDAGRPADARRWLDEMPALDGSVDVWRTRGRALAALDDAPGAIAALRRALVLALDGAVPLSLWMSNRDRRLVDPSHWDDHALLGALYRRQWRIEEAVPHERIAAAAARERG